MYNSNIAYPDNSIINPRNKGSANTDYNMKHYNKSEKSVTKRPQT